MLAPTHLLQTVRQRKTTMDANDAQKLLDEVRGQVLAGRKLPNVSVPDEQTRSTNSERVLNKMSIVIVALQYIDRIHSINQDCCVSRDRFRASRGRIDSKGFQMRVQQWCCGLVCVLILLTFSLVEVRAEEPAASPFAKWEAAISAFEKEDQSSPPTAGGVLFLGSSSIRLWKLDESFPGKGYVNRGFGGSEISDSVHFFDRVVVPHQPRTVVFYAGDNDLSKGKTACRVAEDFQQFTRLMHEKLPNSRLIYVAVKPSIKRWNIVHHGRAANALIEAACIDDPLLIYLDIATPMLGDDGQPRAELFVSDGLHLNSKGYELWTQLLLPHFE